LIRHYVKKETDLERLRLVSFVERTVQQPMTPKILIVDDSKLARMSVAKALNGLHPAWTRLEAANADEAIALAARERPSIALVDYNMPGRDGLVLAAELAALDPTIAVAVVSANIQDEIVARTEAAGACFLAKPLNDRALASFLTEAQERRKAAAP
jgi:DNA-binding NarL/FixJ family response regulator